MANVLKKIFGKKNKESASAEASEAKQASVSKTAAQEKKIPEQAEGQPAFKDEKKADQKEATSSKPTPAPTESKQSTADDKAKKATAPSARPTEKKTSKAEAEQKTVKQDKKETPAQAEAAVQPAEAADTVEANTASLMGKFIIKQAKDGSYMFNLKASNGEVVATSDMYSSLEKCKKGIASVQTNGPIANLEDHTVDGIVTEVVNPKFEMYHDKGGEFRFRLKARNGSIIAKSQGYTSKSNCQNGIESVRKNAMSDVIIDETVVAEVPSDKVAPQIQDTPIAPEENSNTTLMGKFFIKQAKDGSYMFNLKASNGEIIATSDMYSSLEKCKKGISSVQLNAPIANLEDHAIDGAVEEVVNPKFELYHDKGGEFRFRLKARNGAIIAKSQGYSAKANCRNGIESVRKNAMSNEIVMEDAEN